MNPTQAIERTRAVIRRQHKALAAAMGHAQIETTIGYCHADALSVPSPLETT